MAERSLRGTRLGALSMERDEHVVPSERQITTYKCPNRDTSPSCRSPSRPRFRRPGSAAVAPKPSSRAADTPAEPKPVKHVRTHWDMLLERRSIPELEELLEERLTLLRQSRGQRPKKTA
jgi:hypothetical protein